MRTVPPPLVLLLVPCLATAASAGFTCKASTACRSLVGFQPATATSYGGVASLFNASLLFLLAANNLPPATPSSGAINAGSTVRVPIPCRCENGTGRSDRTPMYTVQDGDDGLYNITVARFSYLTTYQEIGTVNNLPNVNNISVGQKLWIPLPCSCDEVGGEEVVHLAHRVAHGSSVDSIAAEFGTDNATLLKLNGMDDPSKLQADQILDVPLHVCSSSIGSNSEDYKSLRLVNDSYATTAGGCVTCSCSATTYRLECFESKVAENGTTQCPPATCGAKLSIGNTTLGSSNCEIIKCSYAGYTNSSNLISVLAANTTDRSNCTNSGSSGEFGLRSGFGWSALVVVFLHMISISF